MKCGENKKKVKFKIEKLKNEKKNKNKLKLAVLFETQWQKCKLKKMKKWQKKSWKLTQKHKNWITVCNSKEISGKCF